MNLRLFSVVAVLLLETVVFAENQHGLFMVVKGDVKITSGSKAPFPVKVGSKVVVGDLITTGKDSRAKIVMADRNVINISPDSRMQIAKYANDAANGTKNVEIKLDQGKIRNNVEQSYDGEKSKFILKTPTAVAGVRGTQFVTSFDSKTQKTQIVTMKGQVTFSSVLNGRVVGTPVTVNKGESTTSSAGAPPEPPKAMPKNELKEIDKESTAANKTKSETVADNGKGDGSRNPASADGPAPKDGPTPKEGMGPKDGNMRDPANVSSENSMVRPDDIGAVKPPIMEGLPTAKPPPMVDRPMLPPLPTAPNPIVREIIRDQIGKTKVIIRPL